MHRPSLVGLIAMTLDLELELELRLGLPSHRPGTRAKARNWLRLVTINRLIDLIRSAHFCTL